MMKTKTCLNCGKSYDTAYPHSKYCGQECYLAYRNKIRPKTYVKPHMALCLWCHGKFESIRTSTRFCCVEHRELFNHVKNEIEKRFYWIEENDKRQAELAKLAVLGMHYTEKCKLKKAEFTFPTEPLSIPKEERFEL